MAKTKEYTVFVYNNHTGIGSNHRNKPLAYLRYNVSDACVHKVREENGARAKSLAIKLHKSCNDQSDKYCWKCPGLDK